MFLEFYISKILYFIFLMFIFIFRVFSRFSLKIPKKLKLRFEFYVYLFCFLCFAFFLYFQKYLIKQILMFCKIENWKQPKNRKPYNPLPFCVLYYNIMDLSKITFFFLKLLENEVCTVVNKLWKLATPKEVTLLVWRKYWMHG